MAKFVYVTDKSIVHSACDTIVNTVNCSGVSGKGIALDFKKWFPDNFNSYRKYCEQNKLVPGGVYPFRAKKGFRTKYILNVATKNQWHYPSDYEWIQKILDYIRVYLEASPDRHIAIPKLGCGCGELDWSIVHEMIRTELINAPQTIFIYGERP